MKRRHRAGRLILIAAVIILFSAPALAGRWDADDNGSRAGRSHSGSARTAALWVKDVAVGLSLAERRLTGGLVEAGLDGLASLLRWFDRMGLVEVQRLPDSGDRSPERLEGAPATRET